MTAQQNTLSPEEKSAFVAPAQQLNEAHAKRTSSKRVNFLLLGVLTLAGAFLLSLITANTLGWDVSPALLLCVVTLIHAVTAVSGHLVVHGTETCDRRERNIGIVLMVCMIGALLVATIFRAENYITNEGDTRVVAYLKSFFIFGIEVLVPLCLGYLTARAHIAFEAAKKHSDVFSQHERLVASQPNPARVWTDSVRQTRSEIRKLEEARNHAQPMERGRIQREVDSKQYVEETLRTWHPTKHYEDPEFTKEGELSETLNPIGPVQQNPIAPAQQNRKRRARIPALRMTKDDPRHKLSVQ